MLKHWKILNLGCSDFHYNRFITCTFICAWQLLVHIDTKNTDINSVGFRKISPLSDFFPLRTANIVTTNTIFQYFLMVLYLAETNKEWKIQANWTSGKLNNQTLKLTTAHCKSSVRMQLKHATAVLTKSLKIALPHELIFLIRFLKNYNHTVHSQVVFVTYTKVNISQYGSQNHA